MAAARQLAFETLRTIDRRQLYAEVAINQALQRSPLSRQERGLFTELVYGVIRQQRRLDCILEQLGDRPSDKQPPDLRRLVHLGLYQLSYCDQVPPSAAVNTTVQLAKENGLKGLSRVINGMLRRYLRVSGDSPWKLPTINDPIVEWGQQYSLPDWVVALFREQLTVDETQTLCRFFDRPPHLDIRINPLKTDRLSVQQALQDVSLPTKIIPGLTAESPTRQKSRGNS